MNSPPKLLVMTGAEPDLPRAWRPRVWTTTRDTNRRLTVRLGRRWWAVALVPRNVWRARKETP